MQQGRPLNIAIIGAGISGLAAAYKIAQKTQQAIRIRIYERNSLVGGNAQTRVASLGVPYDDEKLPGSDYFRWVDLGVNDINLGSYQKVRETMINIGYLTENGKQNLMPLENTVCYFSLDGRHIYTDDNELQVGVSDPRNALHQIKGGVLPALSRIINKAALKLVYPPNGNYRPGHENLDITVPDFFDLLLNDPVTAFNGHHEELHREVNENWNRPEGLKKLKKLIKFLRDYQYYPRISAMYFASDYGAEDMLLAAPFLYYTIQEGINGNEEPDRRYFVGGSQVWVEYFANYLQNEMHNDIISTDIKIELNSEVKVIVNKHNISIDFNDPNKENKVFDYVIMATHADDAQKTIEFNTENDDKACLALQKQESQIRKLLGSISYTRSIAVAHTYSGVLPPDRNAWRCYNVMIREGFGLKPYSMTYVCNRHQNDTQSYEYQRFGFPHFFVTLNPQIHIPDEYVLRQTDAHEIPKDMAKLLPKATLTLASEKNHANDPDRKKCVTRFKHNLLDKACFLAQHELDQYHQSNTRLLFTGGWTNGTGLHEECFIQAEKIANAIL